MADPRLTGEGIDPALWPLIEQLADNSAPAAPGVWPPAPIVWLGLALLIAVAIAVWVWHRRTRTRRRYLRALAAVRALTDADQQLTRLHALLRNAAGEHDPARRALSETEFARQVAKALGREGAPAWVNAHYRPDAGVSVDWAEARTLIRRWCA